MFLSPLVEKKHKRGDAEEQENVAQQGSHKMAKENENDASKQTLEAAKSMEKERGRAQVKKSQFTGVVQNQTCRELDSSDDEGVDSSASGTPGAVRAMPASVKPVRAKPVMSAKQASAKPASAKPASAKPASAKPASAKPAGAKPARSKTSSTKPHTAKKAPSSGAKVAKVDALIIAAKQSFYNSEAGAEHGAFKVLLCVSPSPHACTSRLQ